MPLECFFRKSITSAVFQASGNVCNLKHALSIAVRVTVALKSACFSMRGVMLSGPGAFLLVSELIMRAISLGVT